jgi:hypothetical protein
MAGAPATAVAAPMIQVTGSRLPSITNNQEANVDEGGIVKTIGDHLVILRRGRLFTVSLAGGTMRPVDHIDATPAGSKAGGWYDEMLVSGDRIVVVGYSYARSGTEIVRFRMDPTGKLRFEDAYQLKSNDYYSSRNYASRLVGDRLIFYTPLYLSWNQDPLEAFAGMRRWNPNGPVPAFRRIGSAREVYIPRHFRDSTDARIDTIHSVTSCDLTAPVLDCTARAVLGPASRTFYVSGSAVYLWVSDAWKAPRRRSLARGVLFRMPLGWQRPTAIGVRGSPVDQFSFREDPAEGVLNVLVRAHGGDSMWNPEVTTGDIALMRVRLSQLGAGGRDVPTSYYRPLPKPKGQSWNFHNRFAGDWLLYGAGAYGSEPGSATLYAAPLRRGPVAELTLPHAIDRIELLGRDAMVVGATRAGLGFSSIELAPGAQPRLGDRYLHPAAREGETRSHAYFFSPDPDTPDGANGTLGLPVARPLVHSTSRFLGSSAAMLFLRRQQRQLSPAGELEARPETAKDDGCVTSCVDWYGNARPIFLGERTFALLGYELVEGRLGGGRISEVSRVSFAPAAPSRKR